MHQALAESGFWIEENVLSDAEVFALAHARDGVDRLVGKGGVLVMRPLVIHASSKARVDEPRRVLHVEYSDAAELRPGVRLVIA